MAPCKESVGSGSQPRPRRDSQEGRGENVASSFIPSRGRDPGCHDVGDTVREEQGKAGRAAKAKGGDNCERVNEREMRERVSTYARGTMTAQSQPNMRQPMGTASVVRMTMIAQNARLMTKASQKRLRILGTSSQKLDRSTSFFVAPQVMLYEKRCASRA